MDSSESLVPRCGNSSTAAQEVLWNLQMTVPAVKQEEIEITYEGSSQYSDSMASMYPSDPIQSSEYVNYYDSKDSVFKQVKKEFPDEEYPQSSDSMNSKEVIENNELLNHWDKHKVKNENTGDGLLNIKEEVVDIDYPYSRNTVWIQEQRMLTNDGDASTHYDALLTPREVECQPSGTALKYRVNNKKKERQKRYREQNREKLKQREAERRKRIQYLQSIAGSSTSSNINRIELNKEEIIDANSQSSFGLEGTQTSSIQRNELTKKKNALQKKRECHQRYREKNREKLKQREAERRQRIQNSQMIIESSISSNIEFTEIINELSTNAQSLAGLGEMQHVFIEICQVDRAQMEHKF